MTKDAGEAARQSSRSFKTPSSSFTAATNTSRRSFGSLCWGSVARRRSLPRRGIEETAGVLFKSLAGECDSIGCSAHPSAAGGIDGRIGNARRSLWLCHAGGSVRDLFGLSGRRQPDGDLHLLNTATNSQVDLLAGFMVPQCPLDIEPVGNRPSCQLQNDISGLQ